MSVCTPFNTIIETCQNSPVGKLLPNALYVHQTALSALDPILQDYDRHARITPDIEQATLVKFSTDKPKISYLFYPDFDKNPHPALTFSIVVDMETLKFSEWDYAISDNPPVLHRKETFVTSDYPYYEEFAQLTRFEVALGLLDNPRYIGTHLNWQQRLNSYGIGFEGHRLVCPISNKPGKPLFIERHKAALIRKSLSRPVRLALELGLFTPETTFFDYGCGYGGDIERIAQQGYQSSGWDPYYRPEDPLKASDIVNLGYIINVIEDLQERREALIKAWELTHQVLIVAAQVLIDDRDRGLVAYGDGIITNRNTFQKYYDREELKNYIDGVLQVNAIPVGLGIYFVFRQETQAEAFRLSRYYSRTTTPRIQVKIRRFEDYEDLLKPLMEFYAQRGRLPVKGELANEADLRAEFTTFRRAFQVILQVTQADEWESITQKRRQDLLLYLALSNFSYRPSNSRKLSSHLREDIKALFGSYQQACLLADHLLMRIGNLKTIADLCTTSPIGKKLRHSLMIHISALDALPPLLRLYEGCASRTIGSLDDANVIKFSFNQPKITYLYYPDFDIHPHPMLQTSMEIHLGDIQVRYQDFIDDDNPPILHEKEKLVTPDYPHYEKFAGLTQQEKDAGLLKDFQTINHLQGWLQCLANHCVTIKGHQLQVNSK